MNEIEINNLIELVAESYVESIKLSLINYGLRDSNIIEDIRYSIVNNTLIISMPDYWVYIEDGRLPGKPPPKWVILDWIERKGLFLENQNAAAYAIAKSIGKNGLRARPFLSSAIEDFSKEIANQFAIDFSELIDRSLIDLLNSMELTRIYLGRN